MRVAEPATKVVSHNSFDNPIGIESQTFKECPDTDRLLLTFRSAWKVLFFNGILTTIMHTAICVLDTGADMNQIWSKISPQEYANCLKENRFFFFCTSTKRPLVLDG